MSESIAVVGAGCIGGALGVLLLEHNRDVSFLYRSESVSSYGPFDPSRTPSEPRALTLHRPAGASSVRASPKIFTDDAEVALKDRKIVFVSTKRSTDSTKLASLLGKHLTSGAVVVTLQNGLGAAGALRAKVHELFPDRAKELNVFLDTVVSFNVVSVETGVYTWNSSMDESIVCVDGTSHPREAKAVADAVAGAGVRGSVELVNFLEIQCGKLLMNIVNAPNALAGCDVQDMLKDASYRFVWSRAVEETLAVYAAAGVKPRSPRAEENALIGYLPYLLRFPSFLIHAVLWLKGKNVQGTRTSMAQDMDRRAKETEIDYITGEVVRWGEQVGVDTPVSSALVRLVHEATEKGQGSPKLSGEELMKAVGLA